MMLLLLTRPAYSFGLVERIETTAEILFLLLDSLSHVLLSSSTCTCSLLCTYQEYFVSLRLIRILTSVVLARKQHVFESGCAPAAGTTPLLLVLHTVCK